MDNSGYICFPCVADKWEHTLLLGIAEPTVGIYAHLIRMSKGYIARFVMH